jgi:protein KRI1
MKELKAKLERIGREGGRNLEESTGQYAFFPGRRRDNEGLTVFQSALQELDLEGDWDPEAHDKQMAKIYEVDADGINDEGKPHWDDDIDIGDIVPPEENKATEAKKKKKKKKKKDAEQQATDGGVDIDDMDADVEPRAEEEWDGTEEMRKRKLDEYLDEIYGLEFNDIVRPFPFLYELF